jgi:hypothetical protein
MAKSKLTTLLTSVAIIFSVTACGPSLVLTDVDYSQPIESSLTPNSDNVVNDQRYAISFNIAPILEDENVSSVSEIRLIRNNKGYYFVTASGFEHVYVFEPAESELKLKRKIEITSQGLGQPAFNQRGDYIEVVDRATGDTYRVNEEGIR